MSVSRQNACYALATAVLCIAYFTIFISNGYSFEDGEAAFNPSVNHFTNADQYALLGDAILNGRLYLDFPVPSELEGFSNPYDFDARYAIGSENVPIYWDYAFFEGKYYSYFGVIPALVLFAPFQLLTGSFLSTPAAVLMLGLLVVVGASLLVIRMARVYFPGSANASTVILAMLVFFSACNLPYLGFADTFYSVPILSSMACTMFGLWFWIGSKREGGISAVRLAAGSLLMAMNFGCRPQFMLACFLAFPIFHDEIFKSRRLFSKGSVKETFAALLPFAIVILPLLAYNQARFGSVLDFGSRYNLTIFDMASAHSSPAATLFFLFVMFVEPPHFISAFPFVEVADMPWGASSIKASPIEFALLMLVTLAVVACALVLLFKQALRERGHGWRCPCTVALVVALLFVVYACGTFVLDWRANGLSGALGTYATEPNAGGIFWLCPQLLLVLLIPKVKDVLGSKRLAGMCWMLGIFTVVVAAFDMYSVGPNQRYFSDFAWMLCLLAIICLFAYREKRASEECHPDACKPSFKTMYALVVIALVLSAVIGFETMLAPGRFHSIAQFNPEFYNLIAEFFG